MQIHERFSISQASEVAAEIKRKLAKKEKKKRKREQRKLEALSTAEGDEDLKANGEAEVRVSCTKSVVFSTSSMTILGAGPSRGPVLHLSCLKQTCSDHWQAPINGFDHWCEQDMIICQCLFLFISYMVLTVSSVFQENGDAIKKKKKQEDEDVLTNGVEATTPSKKKKKRKIDTVEAEPEPEVTEEADVTQVEKKKKKKKKKAEDE